MRSPVPDDRRASLVDLTGEGQALIARRQQAHCLSATTCVEFEPEHFQQSAGLVCYYNSSKYHYFYITHDEALGKHIRVMSCLPAQRTMANHTKIVSASATALIRAVLETARALKMFHARVVTRTCADR